ncbi:MAG: hypothetical protein WAU70_03870 [Flavobacteriales bacterium]
MKNIALIAFVWCAFAVHVFVALAAIRRWTELPVLLLLNLTMALCILAYWSMKWFSYLAHDITWYASDQLVPLYAVLVCILALLALTGRYDGPALQWTVFAIDALVLLAAAVLLSLFKIDRLI